MIWSISGVINHPTNENGWQKSVLSLSMIATPPLHQHRSQINQQLKKFIKNFLLLVYIYGWWNWTFESLAGWFHIIKRA